MLVITRKQNETILIDGDTEIVINSIQDKEVVIGITRKLDETILINGDIEIIITSIKGSSSAQVGIDAPEDVDIVRGELVQDDSHV